VPAKSLDLYPATSLHVNSLTEKILLLLHLKNFCRCKRKNADSLDGVTSCTSFLFYLLCQEFLIFFDFEERPIIFVLSAELHKNG
jgi:hypothetical protein